MTKTVPLSEPSLNGREWQYVKRCLDTGWVSTAGQYVDQFERDISAYTKAKHAVATSSGTVALHMGLRVLDVQPGDEVIVPTVTFIAAINVVSYVQARPVFMDCDEFYNIDIEKTIEFIENETVFKDGYSYNKATNQKVKAIIVVHVFGNAVDLKTLMPLCRKRNIKVIEDATESLGTIYTSGRLQNKQAGTIGDVGCYSFNGNKIITAGGGGMLVTKNARTAKLAKYLTTQAKDDALYSIHNTIGYNYRLNNLQAAMGVAQLERLPEILKTKKANFQEYKKHIDQIEGLHLAPTPDYADNNHWMYALQIDKAYGRNRDELMQLLLDEKIQVRPLWHLNHLQKPYRKAQAYKIETAKIFLKNTLNLPCSMGLTKQDIAKIVKLLKQWKR